MTQNIGEGSERLNGVVEQIVYSNSENGYGVIDMSVEGKLITAVGSLATVSPGEVLTVTGAWSMHPTFGRQFRVEGFERNMPKTAADMLRYLGSSVIKGVGPATAQRIVSRFAERSFDVIENSPHELAQIRGISMEKAKSISEQFKKQFAVREVMIELERHGLTASECLAAYKAYNSHAVKMVSDNPYLLCREPISMSFSRADELAQSFLKSELTPSFRRRAGILFVVRHNLDNGHTCLPQDKIIEPACELLDASQQEIISEIDVLVDDKELIRVDIRQRSFLFLPGLYNAEKRIAERIKVLSKFPPPESDATERDIEKIEKKSGIRLEPEQKLAILTAVNKGALVLTGGPGTGKTTTLKAIIDMYEQRKLRVLLAAPTGRAAKRMSEVTGRQAKTLHRLLEAVFSENGNQIFSKNAQNQLEADAIIIDELSMVDVRLFWGLLDALPLGCRLIMVGDSDQLPPVGPGNVLHDIISCSLIEVVRLTRVFRQAMKSLIVTNAHKIVCGEMPILNRTDNDFFFLRRENVFSAASTVCELYSTRLVKAYGYDALSDIQIICPSRKGEVGTVRLNLRLQQVMNPPAPGKAEIEIAGKLLRTGDKVMQIKNNYDLVWTSGKTTSCGVYNGDIGIISDIDTSSQMIRVRFDDKLAFYSFENARELELAYAVTVHKSQGCEFEAVIMPACAIVQQLCYRNLLYTAVTRAKSKLIVVGSEKLIEAMVSNNKKMRRYSALDYFLSQED